MLISVLVVAIFLSGGSTLPFTQLLKTAIHEVKKTVPDSVRRDRAIEVLKQVENLEKRDQKELKKLEETVSKLAARRDTSPREFEAALGGFVALKIASEEQILALRLQLKDALTREEWGRVFPPTSSAGDAGKPR